MKKKLLVLIGVVLSISVIALFGYVKISRIDAFLKNGVEVLTDGEETPIKFHCRCHKDQDNRCYGGNAISFRPACYAGNEVVVCHDYDSNCH